MTNLLAAPFATSSLKSYHTCRYNKLAFGGQFHSYDLINICVCCRQIISIAYINRFWYTQIIIESVDCTRALSVRSFRLLLSWTWWKDNKCINRVYVRWLFPAETFRHWRRLRAELHLETEYYWISQYMGIFSFWKGLYKHSIFFLI